jgi:hypothetical protein
VSDGYDADSISADMFLIPFPELQLHQLKLKTKTGAINETNLRILK